MKTLKWIVSVALLSVLAVSTANAAMVLINHSGGTYGMSGGNTYSATDPSNPGVDTSVLPGVSVGSSFTHDYSFNVAAPGLTTLTGLNVTTGATAIANLVFEWLGVSGPIAITDASGILTGPTGFGAFLASGAQTLRVTGDVISTGTTGLSTAYDFAINTTAVPLPAAFWLFGSALVAFIGFGRRSAA